MKIILFFTVTIIAKNLLSYTTFARVYVPDTTIRDGGVLHNTIVVALFSTDVL